MTKKSVIWLSILLFVIVLIGVLFGAVFCLRKQKVTVIGASPLEISREDIIKTANLENGQSIFMLDKESAISKLEARYPKLKVIQIKTIGLMEIEIVVRARHEMFYSTYNDNYYVMDEELKVLNIIQAETEPSNEPVGLTKIATDNLSINSSTLICDFVGSEHQQNVIYNLYTAMVATVTKTVDGVDGEKEVYFERADINDMLREVSFESFKTFNKLIIKTKHGVVLDIESPEKNLQNKINKCFSTIEKFIEESNDKEKSGTIKIYYDLQNIEHCIYVA